METLNKIDFQNKEFKNISILDLKFTLLNYTSLTKNKLFGIFKHLNECCGYTDDELVSGYINNNTLVLTYERGDVYIGFNEILDSETYKFKYDSLEIKSLFESDNQNQVESLSPDFKIKFSQYLIENIAPIYRCVTLDNFYSRLFGKDDAIKRSVSIRFSKENSLAVVNYKNSHDEYVQYDWAIKFI